MPDRSTDGQPARFIIWTPSFSETNGGAIVLHLLCHLLNEAGENALLWPADRPPPAQSLLAWPRRLWRGLRYALAGGDGTFSTGPFPNRLTRERDLPGSVIVYPEIVGGNPLGGRQVVRWLLHRPGYFTGAVDYEEGDLYFFAVDTYNDTSLNSSLDNRLDLIWMNHAYRDQGSAQREGSCYLLRKGAGRALSHDLGDSTLLDPLSHEMKAREFNRRSLFYCYDPYTMYYFYAAICGCTPVIVPEPGKSKQDWRPREEDRYGLAYGEEEIPWAIATRDKLLERLRDRREDEGRMLRNFIRKCKERLGAG